jgi:hypothetical protein
MNAFSGTIAAARRPALAQYFFVSLGAFCMLLAVVGFGPNLYRYFRGEIYFPPIVLVHGVIMMTWVALYTAQAHFAAHGNLQRHRRVGWMTVAVAGAIWVSMGAAQISALLRYDPDKFAFILRPMLIGVATLVMFPLFLTWAVCARRQTDWHKRLMTLAAFVLIQAALDRMPWLPDEGLPMFWHAGLRLYVLLLLPLFIFDIATLRRLHPASLSGAALIVAMHGVVSFYWDDVGYHHAARGFWMWLRQAS